MQQQQQQQQQKFQRQRYDMSCMRQLSQSVGRIILLPHGFLRHNLMQQPSERCEMLRLPPSANKLSLTCLKQLPEAAAR